MVADGLRISIVLATRNRLARLKRVLAALEAQSLSRRRFEVIVVSDGSTDGTNDFLCRNESLLILRPVLQENHGAAVARNSGIGHARAPLVVFIDDDVVPDRDLLAAHLRRHAGRDEPAVVIGPMLTPPDFALSPWARWEQAMLLKQYRAMIEGAWQPTARQFYTGNSSLPLALLQEAGGFDGSFRRSEDVELAYRLADRGARFLFAPDAIGYHLVERSFAEWLEIACAYGRNDVIIAREKGRSWLLETLFKEFALRHRLVRVLVRMGLDRPLLTNAAQTALHCTATLCARLRNEPGARMCLSGIYNLRYYQGVCDQLEGRKTFFAQARSVGHALELDTVGRAN